MSSISDMPARIARDKGWAFPAIWRLHFYAGVICIPFLLWLSITGPLYLFKPQIDAWLDRPYDNLQITGPRAVPSAVVRAALAAEPGTVLNAYELPQYPTSAVRVLVGRGKNVWRVYVHPTTLQILHVVPENRRLTRILFYLHGEMMLGTGGSMVVELAASWGIVMILSGLYLWWPRDAKGLAGVVYPRLGLSGRVFWKDLHSVVGLWVAAFTLFLLISGLPWAAFWGGTLKDIRGWSAGAQIRQDWTTGSASQAKENAAANDQHAGHHHHGGGKALGAADYEALDRLVPVAAALNLAYPELITPPLAASQSWHARTDAQNRPLRETVSLDASSGKILNRVRFADRPFLDRLIGYGVAIHEGQMFGWLNQLLGLLTGIGVFVLTLSGLIMWLKRRPAGKLGAPATAEARLAAPIWALLVVMGVLLPLMGASLIIVLILDRLVVPRTSAAADFLGLRRA